MNKTYRTLWNESTASWVAAAEIAAAHGPSGTTVRLCNPVRPLLALGFALGLSVVGGAAHAGCSDVLGGNPRVQADGGSPCTFGGSTYSGNNTVIVTGAGTSATFTADPLAVNGASNSWAFSVRTAGASATLQGDTTVFIAAGSNARAIYLDGGTLTAQKGVTATRNGNSGGSALQVTNAATMTVQGNLLAKVESGFADGTRVTGGTLTVQGTTTSTTVSASTGFITNGPASSTLQSLSVTSAGTGVSAATGAKLSATTSQVTATGAGGYGIAASDASTQVKVGNSTLAPAATETAIGVGPASTVIASGAGGQAIRATATTSDVVVQVDAGATVSANGAVIYASNTQPTGKVTVTNRATLTSTAGVGIDISAALGDNTVNSYANINPGAGLNTILGGPGKDAVTLFSGVLNGGISTGAGDDTLNAQGGSVVGAIQLGDGSDVLTLGAGFNRSQVSSLDGGDDADSADGFVDTLNWEAGSATVATGYLKNWERIVVASGNAITWAGATPLVTGTGSDANGPLGLVIRAGASAIRAAGNLSVTGDISNQGLIDLQATSLAASGQFTGGGTVNMNVVLNNGTAQPASQTLTFGSVASGAPTTLNLANIGGTGAATTGNGILVATVTGASPAGAFVLAGPGYMDLGGFRYTLQQVGSNWYLQSEKAVTPSAVNATPVPTLGQYALGLLTLGLGLLAGLRLRQQRN